MGYARRSFRRRVPKLNSLTWRAPLEGPEGLPIVNRECHLFKYTGELIPLPLENFLRHFQKNAEKVRKIAKKYFISIKWNRNLFSYAIK